MAEVDLTNEQRCQLELLAEEYVRLYRAGKAPSLEQFVNDHPELESDIRELFPVMLMLDQGRKSAATVLPRGESAVISSEFELGSRLGEYTLLQVIGRGGMGLVYEAEHATLGSRVAVKLLPTSLNRPKLQERFLREASAAAQMNHPNIVRVFDYGKQGAHHFYVMSLVEGVGLDRVLSLSGPTAESQDQAAIQLASQYQSLAQDRTLAHAERSAAPDSNFEKTKGSTEVSTSPSPIDPKREATANSLSSSIGTQSGRQANSLWEWVADIGVQAADALAYAHQMGVIHRDIKPSNLMMDFEGTLFVTDFGLAKLADDSSLTESGDLLGTLRYLPPEAISGQADQRGDIYGLGLTLYELLAGRPAFHNNERGKLFHDISNGHITSLRKLVPRIPRDLDQIVRKAIDRDVSQRYSSALEMSADLRHFLAQEPISARPPSLSYRTSRWVARNRVITSLAIGLVSVLLAAALLFASSANRYKSLVVEKDAAKKRAEELQHSAQVTSLMSLISEAESWAIRAQVNQRRNGLGTLQDAIELSRELGRFDEFESKFNEIATMLFALDEIETVLQWQQGAVMSTEEPLAFSGDLQSYFWIPQDTPECNMKIFDRSEAGFILAHSFKLEKSIDERDLRASADGRFLIGQSTDSTAFVYDRRDDQFRDTELRLAGTGLSTSLHSNQREFSMITRDSRFITLQLPTCEVVSEFSLPGEMGLNSIMVSPLGDRALVFKRFATDNAFLLDLASGELEYQPCSYALSAASWRPDGQQLALASDLFLEVWDFDNRESVFKSAASHEWTTRVDWLAGGRRLATSGMDGLTRIFNPMARAEVVRCERALAAVAADGEHVVVRSNDKFQQLRVTPTQVLHRSSFYRGGRYFGGILGGTHLFSAFFDGFRITDLKTNSTIEYSQVDLKGITLDPQNRDVFIASTSRGLSRLPISIVEFDGLDSPANKLQSSTSEYVPTRAANPEKSQWTVGPVQALRPVPTSPDPLLWDPARIFGVVFDSRGQQLTLALTEEFDWVNPIQALVQREDWSGAYFRTNYPVSNIQSGSNVPLIVTRSRTAPGIHVINTRTGETVFEAPPSPCWSQLSDDGQQLILSYNSRIEVYDTTTWAVVATSNPNLEIDSGDEFSVSPDDRWLAVESVSPRSVVILDRQTLEPALRLVGDAHDPASDVLPQGFDQTGQWLVAKRGARVLGCWNLAALRRDFESIGLAWPITTLGQGDPAIADREVVFLSTDTPEEIDIPLHELARE